jgi:hypothetical protein
MLTTLYRPVGETELRLIRERGFLGFPPRLPAQPIFYSMLNEEYAGLIARDWNAKYNPERSGYVTRFRARTAFLSRFEWHIVGAASYPELWVPCEELALFNENIVGMIQVVAEFHTGKHA